MRVHLAVERLAEGAIFRESILYPETACREAIVNAIVHRDYSAEGLGIEILVFNDRMEIVSPGGLLADVPIDALRRGEKVHQSRNAYVARVLRELGFVREMGEGIPRIFHAMEIYDLIPPEFASTAQAFSITLHSRSIFSQKDRAWLESFGNIPLTRDEQRVLLFLRERELVSPAEIMRMLSIVDTDQYRRFIEKMRWKGLLVYTMSNSQAMAETKRSRQRGLARERREIPRIKVRSSEECNRFFEELIAAVWRRGLPEGPPAGGANALSTHLHSENPHRQATLSSLVALGLIDDERKPTARLLDLIRRVAAIRDEPARVREEAPAAIQKPSSEEAAAKLLQEVLRLLSTSNNPSGMQVGSIAKRLSSEAQQIVHSLGGEAALVDFLSRQRDRFKLRWERNTWMVGREGNG